MIPFLIGFVLFVIVASAAVGTLKLLVLLVNIVTGHKKPTPDEVKSAFIITFAIPAIFITLFGLIYFKNEENGHLTWHLVGYIIFCLIAANAENGNGVGEKVANLVLLAFPFIWAYYSGFGAVALEVITALI